MNILIHYDKAAQRADAAGFPFFAAAIRSLLVLEIQRADRQTFWQWVLGLPHEIESVEQVCIDGVEVTPNEYLEKLKKCDCCGNDLGPAHACIPWKPRVNGLDLVKECLADPAKPLLIFGGRNIGKNYVERMWHEATQMRAFAKYSSHPVTPHQLRDAEERLKKLRNSGDIWFPNKPAE